MSYADRRPELRPELERLVAPATRIIAPRPHDDVQDLGFRTTQITVSSAVDQMLFKGVAACAIWIRNYAVGGSAMFLLDSTFAANGVLVASNGGAIWVANAAPAAAEVRVWMVGIDVFVRSGATRNGNVLWASMLSTFGP